MSGIPGGIFAPYERLVEITVLGKKVKVPEKNILLRAFQFVSPTTIPYGRFCWNEDCQYCRVVVKGLDGKEHRALSCKVLVRDGMEILWMDRELILNLHKALDLELPDEPEETAPAEGQPPSG